MANPADLLLEVFERWNKNQGHVHKVRADNDTLDTHRYALRYLDQIEILIDELEAQGKRVRYHRHYLSAWVQTVFNYPKAWDSSNVPANIDARQLQQLESLANDLDSLVPRIAPDKVEQLKNYLNLVIETLAEDDSLSEEVKRQAAAVVDHVKTVLDQLDQAGELELQNALDNLLGILVRVGASSKNRERWTDVLNQFVWPFLMGNFTALTSAPLISLLPGA